MGGRKRSLYQRGSRYLSDRAVERLWRAKSRWSIPGSINLCLTDKCNIRCPYCMREEFKPPKAELTLEKVKEIVRRMPYVNSVCIMGLCEPFLNSDTPEILRWLKDEKGMMISFTTNGTVELTEDRLDALTRVDDFVISIDTSDPETFKLLRGGADFTVVMENFKRLIEFKRRKGLCKKDNPPLHINAVVTSRNYNQIPDLIKMLEPYADDITYLMVDPVTRPDYQTFEEPLMLHPDDFQAHFEQYRSIAKTSPLKVVGFDYMFEGSRDWSSCSMAWLAMPIHPNGDVYLCCFNYENVLGNVFEDNPLRIWNNAKARAFRRQLQTDDPPLMQCRSCNFARAGWQPDGTYYKNPEDVLS